MERSNTLRKVIQAKLLTLGTAFPEIAVDRISYGSRAPINMFPHLVFEFTTMTPTDMGREDYVLDVHIWTKDMELALNLQDAIVDLFSFSNDPQETILPTFYLTSAGQLEDPDKTIIHIVVRLETQNYRRN